MQSRCLVNRQCTRFTRCSVDVVTNMTASYTVCLSVCLSVCKLLNSAYSCLYWRYEWNVVRQPSSSCNVSAASGSQSGLASVSFCLSYEWFTPKRFKISKFSLHRTIQRSYDIFYTKLHSHEFRGLPQTNASDTGTPLASSKNLISNLRYLKNDVG